MIVQGAENPLTNTQIMASQNGGDTWTELTSMPVGGGDGLFRVFVAGNDASTLYAWGGSKFYYSTDFGVTADNKIGNMPTLLGGDPFIIGIMGG